MIRGKKVGEAINLLKFTKKEASDWLEKLVLSAVNNWEQKNEDSSAEDFDLFIKTVFVDEGTMLKRFRPRAHGRAHRIRKRTNHVTLIVDNKVALN